ncbi:hypothetical protein [Stenotrophomonas acidaminiphila]|uniref:hypothetical protein n=1 Tax=Stenotrophomonas acidaminiphila TaxID=128780 RepID=UPI0020C61477|nr:hypothetical protein [Stenotrophomonas acidaminiphila]
MSEPPLRTPDGRYLVVRGRLWRATNPALPEEQRQAAVRQLMAARREVGRARRAGDRQALARAGEAVDAAKRALGERGPVWWADGAPDYNRHLARNTPYAAWHAQAAAAGAEPADD